MKKHISSENHLTNPKSYKKKSVSFAGSVILVSMKKVFSSQEIKLELGKCTHESIMSTIINFFRDERNVWIKRNKIVAFFINWTFIQC